MGQLDKPLETMLYLLFLTHLEQNMTFVFIKLEMRWEVGQPTRYPAAA